MQPGFGAPLFGRGAGSFQVEGRGSSFLTMGDGYRPLQEDRAYGLPSRRDRYSGSSFDWRASRYQFEGNEERWIEPSLVQRRSREELLRSSERQRIPLAEEVSYNPYRQPRRFPPQTSPPSDYKYFDSDLRMESRWKTPSGPPLDDPWQHRADIFSSSSPLEFKDNQFQDRLPFEFMSSEPHRSDPGPSRPYSSRRDEDQVRDMIQLVPRAWQSLSCTSFVRRHQEESQDLCTCFLRLLPKGVVEQMTRRL